MKALINSNEKRGKSLLNDDQKIAIDKALKDVDNGKVYSHQDVLKETKKSFPHLFNR